MPTYAQNYLPRFQDYQNEYLERLETLVNIDSGSGQQEGVARIQAHLQDWLEDLGFTVTLHEAERFGQNLLAHRRGRGKHSLLCVGHVDTVYAAGSVKNQPFKIQGGRAYGPGVIDMKSGVLLCLYAVRCLLESGFDQFSDLYLVFNNDEEVGSPGSTPLLRDIAKKVTTALVLEPSRNPGIVATARKGADKYFMEVSGIPAHSGGEPFKGRSAVIEMAHKMLAINNLNSLFPGVTFNITRLNSSERLNIIPDAASCHVSVRAFSEHDLEAAAKALEQIISGSSVPDTHTRLTRVRGRAPYQETPDITRIVQLAEAEALALDIQLVSERKGGVSDANLLMDSGVPTLDGLGPAGGGMHDLQREFLELSSIAPRGALLAGLIQQICLSESTGQ